MNLTRRVYSSWLAYSCTLCISCAHCDCHYRDLAPFEVVEFGIVCILLFLLLTCIVQTTQHGLHACFFPIVFDLCEEGSIRLKLLPVCCWPCHVMSIMGSPSCFEPELVASDVFCICLFMAALALVSSQCCEFLLLCMVVSTASSFDRDCALNLLPFSVMLSDTWHSLLWLASCASQVFEFLPSLITNPIKNTQS